MPRKSRSKTAEAPAQTRLTLQPSIDTASAQQLLEEALRISGETSPLVVDCTQVDFLGSAALQILVALKKSRAERQLDFRLEGVPPSLENWLRIAGLTDDLEPAFAG